MKESPIKTCISTLWLVSVLSIQSVWAVDLPDFTSLVEKSSPAVVSIFSFEGDEGTEALVPEDLIKDLENTPLMQVLEEIYGKDLEKKLYNEDEPGLGSGSIISKDGYIITNYHVVDDAQTIYVQLKNKEEYKADLVGYDEGTDLALLKIQGNNFPHIRFAKEEAKVGQWVVAIGSPFGFEDTLTVGVVSAKRRSLGSEKYVPFIQTDVAINPGNSGGPLLNLDGEMVGINAQIVSEHGSYAGLSFAVPSHIILSVIEQLKTRGYVLRGWLGLAFQDLDRPLAESFGLNRSSGALVSKVLPNSPAQKAGLKVGDVIVTMNGKDIRNATDIPPVVGLLPVGSKLNIEIMRSAKPVTLDLVLESSPSQAIKRQLAVTTKRHLPSNDGIKVRNINVEEDESLDPSIKGVVVMKLQSRVWRKSGLRSGDVIMSLNQEPIHSSQQFYSELNKAPKNKPVSLLITRDGEVQRYIAVKLQR